MRVTDLTKQNSVVRNIQKNSEQLQTLQENMSSGRRINRLSDDPLGAAQVQDYRTRISYFDTVQHVIKQSYTWLDRSEAELEHVGELLQNTKSLILAQANDSADSPSRAVTAEEVRNITEAMVQSGNARVGKIYLFAGSKTFTQPLVQGTALHPAEIDGENLESDLRFLIDLDRFEAEFEGFSQNPYVIRIVSEGPIGRAHYVVSDDGGENWSREKTLLPTTEVVNEQGKPSDKVLLRFPGAQANDLGDPLIFPAGLEIKFNNNPPISYQGNDEKRKIPTSEGILQPINVTAREIFYADPSAPKSQNIFDMMYSIQRALEENDRNALEQRLEELDHAYEQVLLRRADLGSVRRELEDQIGRVTDREFNNVKQMSELEDLDFPAAVTEMNLADVRNKATLDASGRLIQPSLLNFLR